MTTKIGETELEVDAKKLFECRQIVKNLLNFGISEGQKLQIINLLALEMESRRGLEIICEAVKKVRSECEETKINLTEESLGYNEEVNKPKIIDA
jgi:hypothetical protein